jgi:hypothetical protein
MGKRTLWILAVPVLLSTASHSIGADPKALTAKIDEYTAARWTAAKIEPAAPADDAEYLRRVSLELTGRIPSVAEARAFLKDKAADKRQRLVERLLASPRYVTHFTNVWRALLLPEASASFQTRFLVPGFEAWLRKHLAKNTSYDAMVRELLTTPIGGQGVQGLYVFQGQGEPTPLGFYVAKDAKPENLAASTARLFLGVRLECAQCHNHPFASWKREQFWSYAAFFAGIEGQKQGEISIPAREVADRKAMKIPGTKRTVEAAFIDGSAPLWKEKQGTRATLAEWMTRPDNPYFARAAVNRMWAYFFGTGLVDPVDEMAGGDHPASHPELLEDLAREFAASHFDLKYLIRAITASRAYQLGSRGTHPGQDDPHLFARMAVKGLSPEQLFDSLSQATGYQDATAANPYVAFQFGGNSPRTEFLTKFGQAGDKAPEAQTSILQALALMNGKFIADATSVQRSETFAAVVDAPFLDTRGQIETLYLATLSRFPTPRETDRLVRYVEEGGPEGEAKSHEKALADAFWVLLNSGEFILNH